MINTTNYQRNTNQDHTSQNGHHQKVYEQFFIELEQIISQFVRKYKKPQIAKAIMRKKDGTGRVNLPGFRLYYKTIVIKTVWY